MEYGPYPACHVRAEQEATMVRLMVAALVAMGLSMTAPAIAPAVAKQGCGKGYHVNKKGQCVINGQKRTGTCGPGTHLGPKGHCQPN